MGGPVFDRVDRLSETLESYTALVASSPPLLSVLLGLWVAGLQVTVGGDPLVAFVVMMPVVLVIQYTVQFVAESQFEDEPKLSAVEALKRRYVEGRIDDEEFDRRVEKLVGVELADDTGEPTPTTAGHDYSTPEESRAVTDTTETHNS